MSITSENSFETAIIENLTASGGYGEGEAGAFSPELVMFKNDRLRTRSVVPLYRPGGRSLQKN